MKTKVFVPEGIDIDIIRFKPEVKVLVPDSVNEGVKPRIKYSRYNDRRIKVLIPRNSGIVVKSCEYGKGGRVESSSCIRTEGKSKDGIEGLDTHELLILYSACKPEASTVPKVRVLYEEACHNIGILPMKKSKFYEIINDLSEKKMVTVGKNIPRTIAPLVGKETVIRYTENLFCNLRTHCDIEPVKSVERIPEVEAEEEVDADTEVEAEAALREVTPSKRLEPVPLTALQVPQTIEVMVPEELPEELVKIAGCLTKLRNDTHIVKDTYFVDARDCIFYNLSMYGEKPVRVFNLRKSMPFPRFALIGGGEPVVRIFDRGDSALITFKGRCRFDHHLPWSFVCLSNAEKLEVLERLERRCLYTRATRSFRITHREGVIRPENFEEGIAKIKWVLDSLPESKRIGIISKMKQSPLLSQYLLPALGQECIA